MSDSELIQNSLGPTPPIAKKVFGNRLNLAEAYAEMLATDGIERGLIGPREVSRIWERHVLNSAVLGEVVLQNARVIDVGSGAGLPGIPLAIARPDLEVQLLEPLLRRTVFLEEAVAKLGLDCSVHRGRAEDPQIRKAIGGADVATSRAVAPLGKLTGWSLPLVRVGGAMVAIKGSSVHEEIERDAAVIKRTGGGQPEVHSVGMGILEQSTFVVSVPRVS
ncbi:16S rRNA (guanine(527)-N(7))-methyltransferase RsmG [Corynebacterium auriscanis]|uniref:Ribosomal RNA small subunit methyltransferase G n=1 Tax=Corynebacterium auriscanis TaxID=99807 RepID=A0A0A2DG97_9CORY|nr:16S rRNA (guanine(527)-N(7))-methyltransferase RsmG [Corynebacterium auriscanis]KGM18213.1 16S rRNA methyltransferase [Corynebacterium auriscanis]WJY73867.1 Ribosomal RNA small subunit methyltransferase G [Corynebacterium auriscanis]